MGQLFNRISRFLKTETNQRQNASDAEKYIHSDEDDLKKIIDELNNKSSKANSGNSSNEKKKEAPKASQIPHDEAIAYTTLGIEPNSTIDIIKSAYKKKIKEYHPDKVASLGQEFNEIANKKALEINKAYACLRKARGF